jgi:hypothetical protein
MRQRVTKKRAARELAEAAQVPVASIPSVGVGRGERGGRVTRTSGGGINSSSRAHSVCARVRDTTSMQNMQTQVGQLRKKVASMEETERYWRGTIKSQKVTKKDVRWQLSAMDRECVEVDTKTSEES